MVEVKTIELSGKKFKVKKATFSLCKKINEQTKLDFLGGGLKDLKTLTVEQSIDFMNLVLEPEDNIYGEKLKTWFEDNCDSYDMAAVVRFFVMSSREESKNTLTSSPNETLKEVTGK
jgi:hypothetical protein